MKNKLEQKERGSGQNFELLPAWSEQLTDRYVTSIIMKEAERESFTVRCMIVTGSLLSFLSCF